MSYRRFTDSTGTPWRVWEVVPTPLDRRLAARRVRMDKIHHAERRVLHDRRIDMRRSRLFFPPTEPGWLCFESGLLKLRLRPIPQGWALEDDRGLERLCRLALSQPRARQPQPVS